MHIWVDADACPRAAKEILFRTAVRREIQTTLVSNRPLQVPRSPFVRSLVVPHGIDVADDEIVRQVNPGDLVITADVPLAALVIAKGAASMSPRGELSTAENIGERLAIRDFMTDLREEGTETGGPAAFGERQKKAFADRLEAFLAKELKRIP